jgi:hypothetical protein
MMSKLQGENPEKEFDIKAVTADMCLGKNQVSLFPCHG